ncbi:MAG: hypothetical protein II291_02360, partial [Succinivibrio sp.]|nr:hypothetical protein [Succinivibrio sp.]
IALNLQDGDELIGVEVSSGDDDVFLFTSNGYAQHFCEFYKKSADADTDENSDDAADVSESSDDQNDEKSIDRHAGSGIRPSSRTAGCIRGIKMRDKDACVVSLMVVSAEKIENGQCLIASENGYGKRIKLSDIPLRNRGGMGVIIMRNLDRNGKVIGAVSAADNYDYMIISNQGQLMRSAMSDTALISRYGAGTILIRLYEGDSVIAIQSISDEVVENANKTLQARNLEKNEQLAADQSAATAEVQPVQTDTELNENAKENPTEDESSL